MTNYVSLPNAAELVKTLRTHAEYCDMPFSWMNEAYEQAADAIEALMQENAKLKAERDAIRDELVAGGTYCYICKNYISCPAYEDCNGKKFEWRGVQKEEEDATD